MKLKSLKVPTISILCSLLTLISLSSINTFAALEDIDQLGGAYGDLIEAKREYTSEHPEDNTVYECHHLIAREALNKWGDLVFEKCYGNVTQFNAFLIDDKNQNWGPSIIMEQADHAKTLSYYNKDTRSEKENRDAISYIDKQAYMIIKQGNIIGILKDEISFIQKTFGHKYDRAIKEVLFYIKELEFRHERGSVLSMNNPENPNWYFEFHFGK